MFDQGGAKAGSKLQEVSNLGNNYMLEETRFNDHILDEHGPSSTYSNKSKFNSTVDFKRGIDDTFRGNDSLIRPNTRGRSGYIFEKTYSDPIGVDRDGNPVYTMKVVISEDGIVITAFPK